MDRRSAIVAAIGAVIVIGAILIVALSGGDDPDVTVEEEPTDVETVTETETEVVVSPDEAEAEATATPTADDIGDDPTTPAPTEGALAQTYIVGPQEPITTQTSERGTAGGEGLTQFAVIGRYDGEPLPDSLLLGWVSCETADPTAQPVTFADPDTDGEAAFGSETGAAGLSHVNGEQVQTAPNPPEEVDIVDDQLTFAFESFAPDCLVPVVFTDENDNIQLDLDGDGVPTEPFGVAQVEWIE